MALLTDRQRACRMAHELRLDAYVYVQKSLGTLNVQWPHMIYTNPKTDLNPDFSLWFRPDGTIAKIITVPSIKLEMIMRISYKFAVITPPKPHVLVT